MMRIQLATLILPILLLTACQTSPEKEVESIRWVMAEQVSAWNAGDLEGFMQGYWNDPHLKFTGGNGLTEGWQEALDRYKKAYPSKKEMGVLRFENISIELVSSDIGLCTGEWKLDGPQRSQAGYFTLVWKKIDGAWFIIADHSS